MLKPHRRIAVTGLLVAVFTTLLLVIPTLASATPVQDKKAQARAVMAQLDELNVKMEIAVEAYNDATGKLDVVNDKIGDNETALTTARYNLLIAKDTLEARAIAMYKRQPIDLLDVVLASRQLRRADLPGRHAQPPRRRATSTWSTRSRATRSRSPRRAPNCAPTAWQRSSWSPSAVRRRPRSRPRSPGARRMLNGIEDEIAALERQARRAASRQAVDAGVQTLGGTAPPGSPQVVAIAFCKQGCPYQYGAAGPDAFDCSGFTMWCYAPDRHRPAAQRRRPAGHVHAGQRRSGHGR